MKTLAFVTQKGGAGKSTLAACLAVAAQEAGEKVFVLDLDPQASLIGWGEIREADTPQVDTTTPAKLDSALAAIKASGFTLAIIDTAGADSPATSAAMRVADFCAIPSRPSAFDIRATAKTRDTLKTLGKPFAFILNQCPPGAASARAQDGARALEMLGQLVTPMILSRVAYQTAAVKGLGVTEVQAHGPAANEIRQLWASIKRRLGGKHG